jgi:hypothetical protein
MNPSKHARSLYFTPRTPWGRYPQNRPAQSQNYLRASQDAPNVFQKGVNWFKDKFKGGEPFMGVEADKAKGEPGSASLGLGWHKGNGEISTGENPREDTSEAANRSLHVNEPRTTREQLNEQSAVPKNADQIRMAKGIADRAIDQRRRADASYARFLASQKKPGNTGP